VPASCVISNYSKAGKFLEEVLPEEGNPRLPAFKPQKLMVTKAKVTRKQKKNLEVTKRNPICLPAVKQGLILG
jgi:hypothetical protein